jgi:uncharacterized protein
MAGAASEPRSEPRIGHNPENFRYELHLDDRLVAVADYQLSDDSVAFTHTAVEPRFRHKGVAAELVEFALRDVHSLGRRVLPYCSYVSDYIAEHREHLRLVPQERQPEFGYEPI